MQQPCLGTRMRKVQIYHVGTQQVCLWVKGMFYSSLQSSSQSAQSTSTTWNVVEMQVLSPTQDLFISSCI